MGRGSLPGDSEGLGSNDPTLNEPSNKKEKKEPKRERTRYPEMPRGLFDHYTNPIKEIAGQKGEGSR